MTLLVALAAVVLPTPAAEPPPYWTRVAGCGHGHRAQVAGRALDRLLRNHRPLTPRKIERVVHLRRCAMSRADRRRLDRRARRLRTWRMSYAHRWPIAFHSLPAWAQAWARSTSSCETGGTMNPATETGNGYVGAFQFLPSTWYAAGGQGWPSAHSWAYQAVIAVRLMLRDGAGHWPVCGR